MINFYQLLNLDIKKTENIPFKRLFFLPMNKEIHFDKGIIGEKIKQTDVEISFRMFMKKGSKFTAHYHKDCTETILIYKGALLAVELNQKITPNYYLKLSKGAKNTHTILALEDTTFYVEFLKE